MCTRLRHLVGANLFIVIISAVSVAPECRADDVTADELLGAYEASLLPYRHASFELSTKKLHFARPNSPGSLVSEVALKVWRGDDRLRMTISQKDTRRIEGKAHSATTNSDWVYPGQGMTVIKKDPATGKVISVVSRLDDLPEEWKKKFYAFDVALLYGYLGGNGRMLLPETLRQSQLSVRHEAMRGVATLVLEGVGKWGRHTLWLDPNRGYVPLRIEQRKEGSDWVERGRAITSYPPVRASDIFPGASQIAMSRSIENTAFENIGGHFLVTAFTITDNIEFDNRQTVSFRTDVHVSNIKLDPDYTKDDPFTIGKSVPNGTRVQVDDRQGIAFEWRNGEIVKSVNQNSLANLRGNWFRHGPWWGRGLVVLAIVALVGLPVAIYLYRKRGRSAS